MLWIFTMSGRRNGLCLLLAGGLAMVPGRGFRLEAQGQRGAGPAAAGAAAGVKAGTAMTAADRKILHEALDAYDQGDAAKAEPMLRELARRYPGSFEANEALGGLYAEAGEAERALPYLERAVKVAPGEAVAHANLGATYLKLNRTAEAVKELTAAAQLDPANATTEVNLGQALMQEHRPAEAAKALGRASAARPGDWNLRYDWGLALFGAGELREAEEALKGIPEEASTDEMDSLKGDIDEKLGRYKEAVLDYQGAAKKNPSDANLYALTAELLRHWTWGEAIEIAKYGEKLYPGSRHFEVAEGIALYASSQYPAAAATFSNLLAKDPENGMYADLLGRSCSLVVEGVSANCSGLLAFAEHHPENAKAATYAATSLLHRTSEKQDTAEAEKLLRQALAADPKLADAYFEMGVLEQTRLDWKESAAMLEKAVELRPEYPEAHYRLSRAYAHMGEREQAQKEIALQQKYSQQEKDSLNARMQEVVTFVLKPS